MKRTVTCALQGLLVLAICTGVPIVMFPQSNDTTTMDHLEDIASRNGILQQAGETEVDLSDLADQYQELMDNPLNLNADDLAILTQLHLLSEYQEKGLSRYAERYGPIYSIFELKHVDGMDEETIRRLIPFVYMGPRSQPASFPFRKLFRNGKHLLIARYYMVGETAAGYRFAPGSPPVYLGERFGNYLRYGFNYQDVVRFGFTAERDAGEILLPRRLNDSLRGMLGKKVRPFADLFSGYAFAQDIGPMRQVILGDYHLEFGQGLTLWSAGAFGRSSSIDRLKRHGRGIRPNTSSEENHFLRGAAVCLQWAAVRLTGFYSKNKLDATRDSMPGEAIVTGLRTSGKHRTVNEILNSNNLKMQLAGGRVEYRHRQFRAGFTASFTFLSLPWQENNSPQNLHAFRGNQLTNLGIDLEYTRNRFLFYGEISNSRPGGMAGLAGIDFYPADRLTVSIHYRNYGKAYHNFYSNPYRARSESANENGLYIGFKLLLAPRLTLNAYADHYRVPWLSYRTDGPSHGSEYMAQLDIQTGEKSTLYLRYRFRRRQENDLGEYDFVAQVTDQSRQDLRLRMSYEVFDFLRFNSQLDIGYFVPESGTVSSGFVILQDILFRPGHFPLTATVRFCLFDTDNYDSRIYIYEHSLPYTFTVPSFFDSGNRYYVMVRYKLHGVEVGFRLARTRYRQRQTIGSGWEELPGNTKTEIMLQLIYKHSQRSGQKSRSRLKR